jgi:FAD/FMN-containing dehydrogenase
MDLKKEMLEILGPNHISDAPEVLEKYSKDNSFIEPMIPDCVVFPGNTKEVQELVRYANRQHIPVTPRSSGIGFNGAGLPRQGGIVVDLSRMNKILSIDPRNKFVKIEPGVTWGQLQDELEKQDMMVCNPLLPHPLKSVLTSSLEREPILIPKNEYTDTFLTAEMVLPNGEMFWSGTAVGKGLASGNFPDGLYPGARLFTGTQGRMGIVTWANIKAEWLPKKERVFFFSFDNLEDISEPIYSLLRRMIGRECLVLNRFNLATILAEKWAEDFNDLKEKLPPWTLIINLSGLHRHPDEKIEYEEEALLEIASKFDISPSQTVPEIPELSKKVSSMLRKPCLKKEFWKSLYKGSFQDIFFHTTLERVPNFTKGLIELSSNFGYPTEDIGIYLQPLEYGRACFCQYTLPYDPNDQEDIKKVHHFFLDASERIIKGGGFFSTPYGPLEDMVFSRASSFFDVTNIVKSTLDPNNIMNPL